jgi:RNA polymerase sigma-70 factor, ECF subfamily
MTRQETTETQRTEAPASVSADAHPLDLETLYERFKRPIHSYIYRVLGSREDADDLTQEVFLRAHVVWHDLHDHDRLSSWLYRIATNGCIDLLRRRKRLSWWPLTHHHPNSGSGEAGVDEDAAYLPLDSGGIPEIFEREHIRLTLANMPPEYASALVLSAAQGLPYQDIAMILGISPGAAATRISRAKRLFAEQYQRLDPEGLGKPEEDR